MTNYIIVIPTNQGLTLHTREKTSLNQIVYDIRKRFEKNYNMIVDFQYTSSQNKQKCIFYDISDINIDEEPTNDLEICLIRCKNQNDNIENPSLEQKFILEKRKKLHSLQLLTLRSEILNNSILIGSSK